MHQTKLGRAPNLISPTNPTNRCMLQAQQPPEKKKNKINKIPNTRGGNNKRYWGKWDSGETKQMPKTNKLFIIIYVRGRGAETTKNKGQRQ